MLQAINEEAPEVQPYLRAVFSSILIKSSLRESDTSNRRISQQRPPQTTLTVSHKKARQYGRMLDELPDDLPRPLI